MSGSEKLIESQPAKAAFRESEEHYRAVAEAATNEDPVTGGTHTFLAKYWASKLGKTKMKSFQSSKRTGSMDVELIADKLRIRAQAVIVFEGRLAIPA